MTDHLLLSLLSSVMDSQPHAIVVTLTTVTPDEIRLLDSPTAACLDVALAMAKNDLAPSPVLLNAEMVRHGSFAGHHGELAKNRMIDAVTTYAPAVRLPEFASAVLAEIVRARMVSAAAAITERAEGGAESDAWHTFVREGAAVRALWERLCALRGVAA